MALPTNGRVVLETTAGDIDIELWSKEAPKACRNFIALALEGYYDGVLFHRIVPGFLVQTGDRTGTGAGGESVYGEPFEDEIHPRLRFAHRGLVGLANNGTNHSDGTKPTKHSNDSQFFITLDRADELHGKHTLFGRCVGDTVYNVVKIGDMEIDKTGRPVYPPKILRARVPENPFPDIVPRITAAEKRAQARAREQAKREREEEGRRRGAKRNVKLLSFDDEPAEEETSFKKAVVRPDLLPAEPVVPVPDFAAPKGTPAQSELARDTPGTSANEPATSGTKEPVTTGDASARAAEIARMEADIAKLSRKRDGPTSDDEEPTKKKQKRSYLAEELAKYSKGRGGRGVNAKTKGKKRDESDVLAALDSFRDGDPRAAGDTQPFSGGGGPRPTGAAEPPLEETDTDLLEETDTDLDFLTHELRFPKDDGAEGVKAERDYEVIDPRARGAQAKAEERERKNRAGERKSRGGGEHRSRGGGEHRSRGGGGGRGRW
ncbi:cyclophilin-like domain-containing protein [Schizophyllum amplum]|uniref:Cyclophilin-like domain-containing protein n=1 Tax=Schizophyllum amplum TaxID=97359 RepID=A0A550BWD1_9AGAR|nr:cyclophilin-like domain-containing protein [Auriculariopsis ampla]